MIITFVLQSHCKAEMLSELPQLQLMPRSLSNDHYNLQIHIDYCITNMQL